MCVRISSPGDFFFFLFQEEKKGRLENRTKKTENMRHYFSPNSIATNSAQRRFSHDGHPDAGGDGDDVHELVNVGLCENLFWPMIRRHVYLTFQ